MFKHLVSQISPELLKIDLGMKIDIKEFFFGENRYEECMMEAKNNIYNITIKLYDFSVENAKKEFVILWNLFVIIIWICDCSLFVQYYTFITDEEGTFLKFDIINIPPYSQIRIWYVLLLWGADG